MLVQVPHYIRQINEHAKKSLTVTPNVTSDLQLGVSHNVSDLPQNVSDP